MGAGGTGASGRCHPLSGVYDQDADQLRPLSSAREGEAALRVVSTLLGVGVGDDGAAERHCSSSRRCFSLCR